MPCPGPFHFSYSVDYIYDFCPLPDPDVDLSIFVCDVEHTSFYFGLCGCKFVLCLFGQCPGLCTICHSWQHTGVVHLSLQADGKFAFEDVPVFGVCRPACQLYRHNKCNEQMCVCVFRNVVDTKTFPSARSDPTFGVFAVHVRLWKRHECGSLHVFTMTVQATMLRRCNFLPVDKRALLP